MDSINYRENMVKVGLNTMLEGIEIQKTHASSFVSIGFTIAHIKNPLGECS
jgi:hypothetical protein